MDIITVGGVASLILEGIKWIVRKIMGNMEYDFPAWVYTLSLPVLAFFVQPLLVWLGVLPAEPIVWDWQLLVKVILESLIAVVTYTAGIKPLKEYARSLKE